MTQYFSYTRGGGQGEARLRTKRSIGVGGHIASTDGEHGDNASYEAGMLRELKEEVAISGDFTSRCVGLINDDATPVGSVHLGIVHILELQSPEVESREVDLLECGFQSSEKLLADRNSSKHGLRLLWMQLKPAFLDNSRNKYHGCVHTELVGNIQ